LGVVIHALTSAIDPAIFRRSTNLFISNESKRDIIILSNLLQSLGGFPKNN